MILIILTGNDEEKIYETKRRLSSEFKLKMMGEPEKFLGIQIKRDKNNRILKMTQTEFIEALLKRFKLEHAQVSATPRKTNETIKKNLDKVRARTKLKLQKKIPFRQLVGALLYIANSTRPEISFAVNKLCQKQSNFSLDDWVDAERVLRFRFDKRIRLNLHRTKFRFSSL